LVRVADTSFLMPFKSSVKTHGPGLPSFYAALGLVTALITAFYNPFRIGRFISCLPSVRLKFSTWMAMALEFQLGADIVATTVNPFAVPGRTGG